MLTLRWRALEKGVGRLVRGEVRSSPRLGQDYSAEREAHSRMRQIRPWVWRLVFVVVLFIVYAIPGASLAPLTAFMVIATLAAMFLRANQLLDRLYFSPRLHAFNHLPISDDAIFVALWNQWLCSCLWSVVDFSLVYCVLAFKAGAGAYSALIGPAFGLVQGLFIVLAAACLFAYGPRGLLNLITSLLVPSAFAILFFGHFAPAVLGRISDLSYWIPPVGWTFYALGISPGRGFAENLVPCVMAAVILALYPLAYRQTRRTYTLNEQTFSRARRAHAVGSAEASGLVGRAGEFSQSPADAQANIQSRGFLLGMNWRDAGPAERVVSRLLSTRERTIAEFLVAANPRWTAGLRTLGIFLLVLIGASWLFALGGRIPPSMLLFGGLYFLATISGRWRGASAPTGGGLQSPFFALYPIGMWELMRTILKINMALLAIALPLLLAAGAIATKDVRLSAGIASWALPKLAALAFMLQPVLAIFPISPHTNDTKDPGVVLLAALGACLLVGAGATFVFAESPLVFLTAGAATALLCAASLLLYVRLLNRSRIDLVPQTKAGMPAADPRVVTGPYNIPFQT